MTSRSIVNAFHRDTLTLVPRCAFQMESATSEHACTKRKANQKNTRKHLHRRNYQPHRTHDQPKLGYVLVLGVISSEFTVLYSVF